MTLDTSCFDGVLGLASCACPCLADIAPEGYTTASSGLYVTDLIPMSMLETAADCSDPENPWNIMDRARAEAKVTLLKDIRAGLMKGNQYTRIPFSGMIGEKTARETMAISKTYAGVRVRSARIKGGYLNVTRIGGIFAATGTVSVSVKDRFNNTIGSAVTINTTAGIYSQATCNFSLPLWVDGADNAEYYFVYTVNQSNLPKQNRLWCTTCKREPLPIFNADHPYYSSAKFIGSTAWANWMMVSGWTGDTLTDFDLAAEEALSTSQYLHGLCLQCELVCDPATAVCLDELDFSDPVALSAAHAFRYMTAILTAERIIRNPQPYRAAAVSREVLAVDIKQWYADYKTNIDYVNHNANMNKNSDCIFCKPKYSMSLQSRLP